MISKPFYSPADLQESFGIGHSTLAKMIDSGLPVCHTYPGSRCYFVLHEDLISFLGRNKRKAYVPEVPRV